jgi:hypothetical protein
MKRIFDFGIILSSFLLISGIVISQQQNTTPQGTDYIQCNLDVGGNGIHEYEFVALQPIPSGAHNAHLWWSGDNAFYFAPTPLHAHPVSGSPYTARMTDIVTENYGNGGPPPLTFTYTTRGGNKSPQVVLDPGMRIYMQNYRNAVIGDTMYLIVTYGNNTGSKMNGRLTFDVGSYGQIVDNMITTTHRHFLPNNEQWDANRDECTFGDLNIGEERSILIPVLIQQNQEDELTMRVDFYQEYQEEHENQLGINYYELSATVAESHDPNLMLESSDAQNQCDYRNGTIHYTVKFQNVGDTATKYVRVETTLDNKVDMDKITGIELPAVFNGAYDSTSSIVGSHDQGRGAIVHIDKANRKIIFELHDLRLWGTGQTTLTDLELTRDQVEFDIKVKSNYVFGPATTASSLIFFDDNDPIATNEVETICGDPLPESQGGGFQKTKPTFWEKWKWYIISIAAAVVGLLGLRGLRRRK